MKRIILFVLLAFPLSAFAQFSSPMSGQQNQDWYVWSYFDHDTASGSVRNFACNQYCYDNWHGLIYVLKNLKLMDQGMPVTAAGPGRVVAIRSTSDDRTRSSVSTDHGNFVRIQHGPNLFSYYAYLRHGSIQVALGDSVNTGQTLAMVGSSGGAYYAKLYFRFEDSTGRYIDPMGDNCDLVSIPPMISPTPVYDTSFGVIDFGITTGALIGSDSLMERPADRTNIGISQSANDTVWGWLQYKNRFTNDSLTDIWIDPHGSVFHRSTVHAASDFHFGYHSHGFAVADLALFQSTFDHPVDTGTWTIEWHHKGETIAQSTFHLAVDNGGIVASKPTADLEFYPQPANEFVRIRGARISRAELYSLTGERVTTSLEANGDSESVLHWKRLAPGVYTVRLWRADGQTVASTIVIN